MPSSTEIGLVELGVVSYGRALTLQHELRARLVGGDLPDRRAGYLVCLEHEPVVTLGKRGLPEHLLDPDDLEDRGIEVFETDRGGEATFHGPGQLVVYPIVALDRFDLGVVDLVRGLAECISGAFEEFGVEASYDTDHPGVWTDGESERRKLASVGMRVHDGTSTHGAAINLVNDMSPFRLIVPCGMSAASMARLADYVDDSDREAIRPAAFRHLLYPDFEALTETELSPVEVELPRPEDSAEAVDL